MTGIDITNPTMESVADIADRSHADNHQQESDHQEMREKEILKLLRVYISEIESIVSPAYNLSKDSRENFTLLLDVMKSTAKRCVVEDKFKDIQL